jgi:putative heme-binding domain-containing protein
MPATPMTREQAQKIVAYLRSRAAAATTGAIAGDAARGQALFNGKGTCTTCHRVGASGSRVGPDLTAIGSARGTAELQRALVDPNADVAPGNRFYRVVLKDGRAIEGRLLSHDTFTVQLLDTTEQLRSFHKSDLRESGFIASPMPSYQGTLSPQELADVVSYLASLRGR